MKKAFRILSLFVVCLMFVLVAGCKKNCKKNPPQEIVSISVVKDTIPESILNTEVDDKIDDIKFEVLKSDDTKETKNVEKSMISDEDYVKLANEGTHTITITYQKVSTTVTLVIVKSSSTDEITSIELVRDSVPEKILSSEIDEQISKIKFNVIKSSGSKETKNVSKDMISNTDYNKLSQGGTHTITINYQGFTTTVTLVIEKDDDTINYTICIKDIAGKALDGFYVEFTLNGEIVAEGYTGNDGTFSTNQLPNKYEVYLESVEGYYLNQEQELFTTDLLGGEINIVAGLDSFKGVETDITHRYEVGDLMYDFTLTDIDNNSLNLYTLLETYEVVILNFWYTGCTYCIQEFPSISEAYNGAYEDADGNTVLYSDKVAIIAVNPGNVGNNGQGDTLEMIKNFKVNQGLPFNVALDNDGNTMLGHQPFLTTTFNLAAYPTTVIIDRFGLIAEIEEGAVIGADKWTQTFDAYIGEDYIPVYRGPGNSAVERPKPDFEQAPSADFEEIIGGTNYDGSKFEGTYLPEDNPNDAPYSWPWVVTDLDGVKCMKPSNKDLNSSFSIIYVTTNMKKGDVLAFDYYASSEDYDKLYLVIDGIITSELSGEIDEWKTNYTFVAEYDGKYEVGFCFIKDQSYANGDDTVYVKNIRIAQTSEINEPTYIYRECAIGEVNEFTMAYNQYAEVVYNADDGYYHVGSETGPLLFADMLTSTKWNTNNIYTIALDGLCVGADDIDYFDIIEEYSVYANNSTIGYTPVTEELANALRQVVKALGDPAAANNPNQWLELCVYYSAYGTNGVELGLPIIGVSKLEPIMFEGNGIDEPATATANIDRVIFPRGFIFGFTPEVSGVYMFYTAEEILDTMGWVCDENGVPEGEPENGLREYVIKGTGNGISTNNIVCFKYLEAGKKYLFRACYYNVDDYGQIKVEIKYQSDKMELLTIASPGFFTSSNDDMSDIISGNYIDIELGDDGYYHAKDSMASDTFLYCDVRYYNSILNYTLEACVGIGGFDFSKDEFEMPIVDDDGYLRATFEDTITNEEGEEEQVLVSYYICTDEKGNEYYTKTLNEGEYTPENGYTYVKLTPEQIDDLGLKDYTEYVREYIKNNTESDETSELFGCVKVDEQFAKVLSHLMNKYTFAGVEYSWAKLCYYYKYVGPVAVTE